MQRHFRNHRGVARFPRRHAAPLTGCVTAANHFAAAVMMPYQAFHTAAEALSYDVHVLAQRFDAGFEQVCHRLTTLTPCLCARRAVLHAACRQRRQCLQAICPSSCTFPFSKNRSAPAPCGTCTRPSTRRTVCSIIQLPDGARYFSIAQMVRRPVAPHPQAQPRFAIGLGCEIRHAPRLVYASGMDLETEGTPIGVNCRLCERENCSQRAEPPITRDLDEIDENTRRVSSFAFSNARNLLVKSFDQFGHRPAARPLHVVQSGTMPDPEPGGGAV